MKHYSVHIPTKPYLYKYVTAREGSPLFMNSDSPVCLMLRCCLGKEVHSGLQSEERTRRMQSFTRNIQIRIPISKMRFYGFSLKEHNIILINRFIENDFETELVRYCRYFINDNVRYAGYKEAYESFSEKHLISLEEDIPYDTLKKIEYRARKKTKNICSRYVPSRISEATATRF